MMLTQYMPNRELWEKIKTIVLPISLQNLLMQADSAIDSIMLGHVSQEALSSVSLAGQVQFIFNLLRMFGFALMAGLAGMLFIIGSTPFVNYLAKLTPRAADLTVGMLILLLPAVFSKACNGVTVQSFNTGGDARFSFKMDVWVSVCTVIPLGLLAAFLHWPVLLVFFIVNMDEVLKRPVFIRHFFGFSWLCNLTEIRGKTA